MGGGPSPVRNYLPDLLDPVWNRKIDPGKVCDLVLPLDQAAEGYRDGSAPRHHGGRPCQCLDQHARLQTAHVLTANAGIDRSPDRESYRADF